tara:strand:- start:322 stop:513 length:192 start_codon:yes stop_codon:yes gene_type:complete
MEGGIYIEAKGLGVSLRAPFIPKEDPLIAADVLILKEETNRKYLYKTWKSKNNKQCYKINKSN